MKIYKERVIRLTVIRKSVAGFKMLPLFTQEEGRQSRRSGFQVVTFVHIRRRTTNPNKLVSRCYLCSHKKKDDGPEEVSFKMLPLFT